MKKTTFIKSYSSSKFNYKKEPVIGPLLFSPSPPIHPFGSGNGEMFLN
jgi:hypothetical protein